MNWLYQREEHCVRFFKTKWNSPVSFKWWHKIGQWNFKFRDHYAEINLGRFSVRIRSNH